VIKTSDWIIDMGPAGGHKGGMVVAIGTPEEIADTPESATGEWLRHVLGLSGTAKPGGAGAALALERAAKANVGARVEPVSPAVPPAPAARSAAKATSGRAAAGTARANGGTTAAARTTGAKARTTAAASTTPTRRTRPTS
jgi:excinuclease ABC subunit A